MCALIVERIKNKFLNFEFIWKDNENDANTSTTYFFNFFVFWKYLEKHVVKIWVMTELLKEKEEMGERGGGRSPGHNLNITDEFTDGFYR